MDVHISKAGSWKRGTTTDLNLGNLYINITDPVFPSGEIRGQIGAVPEPATMALMGAGSLALLAMRRRRV